MEKLRVGISIGDPNGIGMEIIIKTLLDNRICELCTPIVYGSSKLAAYYRKALNINNFSFNIITDADKAHKKKPNLVNLWDEEVKLDVGQETKSGGEYALKSLEAACEDLKNEKIDVLVTAPISKHNIQSKEFDFEGHTEYLGSKFDGEPIMIMAGEYMKVALVTGHVALEKVKPEITSENIYKKLTQLNKSLHHDFGIAKPRIAVLGLNPHAGDSGLIGNEEQEQIIPAIREAKNTGILAFGPYGADGFFGSGAYKDFDISLAMYHDQGLIPFKTIDFDKGINFTSGLNIVRTSPAHGTAYELAGKNIASPNSMRNAIYMAIDIFRSREEYEEATENPLKVKPKTT